ncbi:hypothetical protein IMCC26134_05600 [Verrucomicrobia bacterium IMCC26134]|nr:hypothetical protein IMCC26134_05600 [Verrucomicrobia bacterium IMCC26134]
MNTKDYSVLLQALQSKTDTRIASNPTIVAVNGMKSTISVGKEIQLVKTTQTNSAGSDPISTTEKDGVIFEGIKIEVTPQITSKKLVSLAINANKTIASESASKAEGGTIKQVFYDINKREANLTMLLQDGQTAAIGGLVDRKADKVTTKVPLLGDIPIIGNLFKTKKNSDQNTNLIIFITANILEPSKTTYKNVSTSEQLYDLNVTERDIKGISYEKSAEEAQLYDATDKKRQDEQDAKIRLKLRVPNQKSK